MKSLSKALQQIPNIGPAMAEDLIRLGIRSIEDLAKKDPDKMYARLCEIDRRKHDICVRDVFEAAVTYTRGGPDRPWWYYSRRRKAKQAKR